MSDLAGWLLADVTLPRWVVWTILLTSPALWSTWAKQRFAERLQTGK